MQNILLIRHGESIANAGLASSDPRNVPLSPRGEQQAKAVARYLFHYAPDMLVTSRFLRARQTSIPTQRLFRHIPYEIWDVQEFTYLSSLHHLRLTQAARSPYVEEYWRNLDPTTRDAEDSETFRGFIQRARNFLQKVFLPPQNQHELGAIFSHEQFILAVLWLVEKQPEEITSQAMRDYYTYFQTHRVPNGGIIQLRFHPHEEKWTGELITAHLNQPEQYPWPVGSYSMTAAD